MNIQSAQGLPLDNSLIPAVASGLASLGRFEDTYIVHAAKGETVIPKEVLDANPILKAQLFQQMQAIGIQNPERYIIGNELNSINPVTGQPEFFLRGVKKFFRKALPTIGAIIGGVATGGSPFGAAAGSFLGSKLAGQETEQAVLSAALSGGGQYFLGPLAEGAEAATQTGASEGLAKLLGTETILGMAPATIQSGIASGIGPLLMATAGEYEDPLAGQGGSRTDVVGDRYKKLWAELGVTKYSDLPNDLVPPPPQLTNLAALRTSRPDAGALLLANEEQEALQRNLAGYPGGQNIFPIQAPQQVFAQSGGMISGPGGPKEDQIPAMLSDGEFVFTAKAVRGADPNGSRQNQARKMYGIMRELEGRA